MMQSESSSELLNGILGDAGKEAEKLVEQARIQAGETVDTARNRAAEILNGAEKNAEKQGAELKKNSRSSLVLLQSRQELKSSRKLAAEVMRRVRIRLEDYRKNRAYPALLEDLVLEAALGLGVPEAKVNGGGAERALMKKELLARVEARLKEDFGETVSLSLSDDVPLEEQGVELSDSEGRRAFRNSFSARLDRHEQEIRDIIESRLREASDLPSAAAEAGSSDDSVKTETAGESGEDKA